jgi:hypothetical protein
VAHPGDHTRQGYFHTFLTAHLGIRARATVIQVLGNGMTGGHAFDVALQQVSSGQADCALSVGVHFETGVPTARHLDYSIRLTGDVDFQSEFGAVPIAWSWALIQKPTIAKANKINPAAMALAFNLTGPLPPTSMPGQRAHNRRRPPPAGAVTVPPSRRASPGVSTAGAQ